MPKLESVTVSRRIEREKQTIRSMLQIFCTDHHKGVDLLCDECKQLLDYAWRRLDSCPFQEAKPACNHCQVHCYAKEKRQRMKEVMRYAGPRMIYRHPYQSLLHLFDKLRKVPQLPNRKGGQKDHPCP
jgi:hypothetical protein